MLMMSTWNHRTSEFVDDATALSFLPLEFFFQRCRSCLFPSAAAALSLDVWWRADAAAVWKGQCGQCPRLGARVGDGISK